MCILLETTLEFHQVQKRMRGLAWRWEEQAARAAPARQQALTKTWGLAPNPFREAYHKDKSRKQESKVEKEKNQWNQNLFFEKIQKFLQNCR